jgi:hypothetical protein
MESPRWHPWVIGALVLAIATLAVVVVQLPGSPWTWQEMVWFLRLLVMIGGGWSVVYVAAILTDARLGWAFFGATMLVLGLMDLPTYR